MNLAFFSGNEVFWKTRWEDNHRTLVCYKETHAGAKIDPLPNVWTGSWRDPRFSPTAEGARPENALTGTIFLVNAGTSAIEVPAADGPAALLARHERREPAGRAARDARRRHARLRVGRGSRQRRAAGGAGAPLVDHARPTSRSCRTSARLYASGNAHHHLTLYRDPNGALACSAPAPSSGRGASTRTTTAAAGAVSPAMQQATYNLFADMGAQPATLQAGLLPAVGVDRHDRADRHDHLAGDDRSAPATPATVQRDGDATPAAACVGAVEVSTDGGATWHPAAGREHLDLHAGRRRLRAAPSRRSRAPRTTAAT